MPFIYRRYSKKNCISLCNFSKMFIISLQRCGYNLFLSESRISGYHPFSIMCMLQNAIVIMKKLQQKLNSGSPKSVILGRGGATKRVERNFCKKCRKRVNVCDDVASCTEKDITYQDDINNRYMCNNLCFADYIHRNYP